MDSGSIHLDFHQTKLTPIPKGSDGDAFYVFWTGGIRICKVDDDSWSIDPILHGDDACTKGFAKKVDLFRFLRARGLLLVAFQSVHWHRGGCSASWSPFILGASNHREGPADLWGHIAANLSSRRTRELRQLENLDVESVAAIVDNKEPLEHASGSISLSLRNMDIAAEAITEFYHNRLIEHLREGLRDGCLSGSPQDSALYAQVQAFFMHLGAARDYLALFISRRLGKPPKIDSMNRLIDSVRQPDIEAEPLLQLLVQRGDLVPLHSTSSRWIASGSLNAITEIRNELVHSRNYGERLNEKFGWISAVDQSVGLFRYCRPFVRKGQKADILDIVVEHYQQATALFYRAARTTRLDAAMLTFTDDDIISVDIT